MLSKYLALSLWTGLTLVGQTRPDLQAMLERLDRLEEQNRQLISDIRSLRQQLAAVPNTTANPAPAAAPQATSTAAAPTTPVIPDAESTIQERRIEELDQTKIGTDQRLPVTLTGTVLFNAFLNGHSNGGRMNPVIASETPGEITAGGSLRQTVLGLRFQGPSIAGGGKVSGTLFLDLFAGTGTSLNQLMRLRVATLDLGWKNTTVSFGQDKPILAPREPDSLAQVGVSPLTAAGNLWLWQPQVRVEQRLSFGEGSGLRAQGGVFQTNEDNAGVPSEYASTLAAARPGFEGRVEWWGERSGRRFEIAPGFHISDTHVLGQSAPSRIFSVDWMLRPFPRLDFAGQFFQGENVGVIGGLAQGVRVLHEYDLVRPVHAQGGWGQLTFRATPRLSFHVYGGEEDDRNSDLAHGAIGKNIIYAGNIMYRFGSNVLASFETSQTRTTYIGAGTKLNPHYDLALAYLF